MNKIEEARTAINMTRSDMSAYFDIPVRTIEDWDAGKRKPAPWAEKLILERLDSLKRPSIMKKFIKKFGLSAMDQLIPSDYNVFCGVAPEYDYNKLFRIVHDEMKKIGFEDSDYEIVPHDIDPKYFENVRAGKEIHKMDF